MHGAMACHRLRQSGLPWVPGSFGSRYKIEILTHSRCVASTRCIRHDVPSTYAIEDITSDDQTSSVCPGSLSCNGNDSVSSSIGANVASRDHTAAATAADAENKTPLRKYHRSPVLSGIFSINRPHSNRAALSRWRDHRGTGEANGAFLNNP
jgi:hypothetical protein